jgi:hypothetical protein
MDRLLHRLEGIEKYIFNDPVFKILMNSHTTLSYMPLRV